MKDSMQVVVHSYVYIYSDSFFLWKYNVTKMFFYFALFISNLKIKACLRQYLNSKVFLTSRACCFAQRSCTPLWSSAERSDCHALKFFQLLSLPLALQFHSVGRSELTSELPTDFKSANVSRRHDYLFCVLTAAERGKPCAIGLIL